MSGSSVDEYDVVLRMDDVVILLGVSESTVRRMIDRGEFPAPIQLSSRVVGWFSSEVRDFLETKAKTRRRTGAPTKAKIRGKKRATAVPKALRGTRRAGGTTVSQTLKAP